MKKTNSFANSLRTYADKYGLRTVFEDFVNFALSGFLRDVETGKWNAENELLGLLGKYPDAGGRLLHALTFLDAEIRHRQEKKNPCIDLLGEFYELFLHNQGLTSVFTSWRSCERIVREITYKTTADSPIVILEPNCGSGRVLLAAADYAGLHNIFFGVDKDPLFVKMAALNLWSAGMPFAEVVCADTSIPGDFCESYAIAQQHSGIVRITKKEDSEAWHYLKATVWAEGETILAKHVFLR